MAEYLIWGQVVNGRVYIRVFGKTENEQVTLMVYNTISGRSLSKTEYAQPFYGEPPYIEPISSIDSSTDNVLSYSGICNPFFNLTEFQFNSQLGFEFRDANSANFRLFNKTQTARLDADVSLWPAFDLTNDGMTLKFPDIAEATGYEIYRNGVKIADIK